MTSLGNEVFASCTSLTEVKLGTGLTGIGEGAFSGCTALTGIELPDSVTRIERDAFRGATSLSKVVLSKGLTYLGGRAFGSCTALTSIEIPASLEKSDTYFEGPFFDTGLKTVTFEAGTTRVASYLFESCRSLEEIELPEGITQIGEGAFQDCTGLSGIELPDSVTSLGKYAFNGCTGLTGIELPDGVETLESYIFAGCTNLNRLSLGSETSRIDRFAFHNSPNLTIYTEYGTKGHICIIENRILAQLTTFAYEDYTELALQPGCSYYADFGSLSSNGYVKLSLHYELSEEIFSRSDQRYIRFYLPLESQIFQEELTADGEILTEYTVEDGLVSIPVEKRQGDITCGFSLANATDLVTAAIYEYRIDGITEKEVLGYDNNSHSVITVSCTEQVSSPQLTVTGLGTPSGKIQLYLGGTLLTTVTASKTGTYKAEVTIPDPVSGTSYLLEARNAADESQTAQTVFLYDDSAPELTEFIMYYNNHADVSMDLMNTKSKQYVTFNPQIPFTFTIRFDNQESVEEVYIVSTRNNERKVLEAEYDPATDQFIASGYFDDSNHKYVPGNLKVEFRCKQEEIKVGQDVDWDGMYQNLSSDIKKTKITTVTEGSQQRYHLDFSDVSEDMRDTGIDLIISSIDDAAETELDDWKSWGESLYHLGGYFIPGLDDDRYIVASHSDPMEYTLMVAKDSADLTKGAVKVQISLQDGGEWTKLDDALEQLGYVTSGLSAASDIYGFAKDRDQLINEIYQSPHIKDKGEAVRQANQLFEDQKAYTILMTALPLIVTAAGVTGPAGIGFTALVGMIGALSTVFWQYRTNNIKSQEVSIRWIIDPSGYVYEAVEENRLSGVKATVYYKENLEDTEALLWDASEYDQQNPLYTDGNGAYAWDVPEGFWQVKYEKDGYETVYSDWLPVPPPQTDVNIGMVSKEKPVLESSVIYADHADLVFSKYMAPDTVSSLKLQDAEGNNVPYTLVYDTNAVNADGVNYAKSYTLQFQSDTVLTPGDVCTLTVAGTEKSYADVAMDRAVIPMAVRKNMEVIAPDEVTVAMGGTVSVPVWIVNGEEGTAFRAVSEAEQIASVEAAEGSILITGRIYGEVQVTVCIPGTDVSKTIRVTVGKQTVIPPVVPSVVLPQSVYRMTAGESLTIEPEIYPDSASAGSWSVTGSAGIVTVEGNTVTAKAGGETVLRYTLEGYEEIYAECTVIVTDAGGGGPVELPYRDVKADDWFYDAVKYVYEHKIMTGVGDGTLFAPYQTLARAQFALILYRMNGEPEVSYRDIFPDVQDGVWYTDAILWAAGTGVVTGYSSTGCFGPADNINREQMAVMMYRYARYKGYQTSSAADFSQYLDADRVSSFAEEAMKWAVGEGIITGKFEQTMLDPQGSASRAECAIIIMRFMQKYES